MAGRDGGSSTSAVLLGAALGAGSLRRGPGARDRGRRRGPAAGSAAPPSRPTATRWRIGTVRIRLHGVDAPNPTRAAGTPAAATGIAAAPPATAWRP